MIRDDHKDEEEIAEVFGEKAMGFRAQDDQFFRKKMDAHSESAIDDITGDLDLDTNSVAYGGP